MNREAEAAYEVLCVLEKAGFQAYWVGGCVRDRLLGKIPVDYDIATNATPDQVQSLFSRTVATGLKHGTVAVLRKGCMIEVTTFRKEYDYTDYRRPKKVEYVGDLKTDLTRRDFTINAMAEDRHHRLYDPCQGKTDLEQGRIRAVGDPEKRFTEDALRIIRGIRFSAQLGFHIDGNTQAAIASTRTLLPYLSVERIKDELEKVWKAEHPSRAIRQMWKHQLFSCLPPFCQWSGLPGTPTLPETVFDKVSSREERWALLLLQCGTTSEQSYSHLYQLRLSRYDIQRIHTVIQLACQWTSEIDEDSGKRLLLTHGLELVLKGFQIACRLQPLNHDTPAYFRRWWGEMPVKKMEDLPVNGVDLLQATDHLPGPWVGQVLRYLLEETALGRLSCDPVTLLEKGCQMIGKSDS